MDFLEAYKRRERIVFSMEIPSFTHNDTSGDNPDDALLPKRRPASVDPSGCLVCAVHYARKDMRSRLPYHAHRRWFEWKDWRDILLGQVVERLQSQENAVAVAVMIGEAHGYELQYEVVQVSDGSVWRAGWSEFQRDAPVDLKSSSMECDLIADLSELHAEHPASRVTLPEDSSRGRYMVLFVATMSFKKWITGQTRLSGEPRQGALDRIVDILFGQPASAP